MEGGKGGGEVAVGSVSGSDVVACSGEDMRSCTAGRCCAGGTGAAILGAGGGDGAYPFSGYCCGY